MKQRLILLTSLLLSVSAAWAWDFAYNYNGQNLYFEYTNVDGECALASVEGYVFGDEFTLPSVVSNAGRNYTVTRIGEDAFQHSEIKIISLPSTLKEIGRYAFFNCGSLTNITIPENVTSIGDGAFHCCNNLNDITIKVSDPTTINAENAFDGFNNFETCTLYVPSRSSDLYKASECWGRFTNIISQPGFYDKFTADGITYIVVNGLNVNVTKGDTPYSGAITIPSEVHYANLDYQVTGVGKNAFFSCTALTEIIIPNSVTSIGESAFDSCSALTGINIPNSVTSIGRYAFFSCTALTEIIIPNSVTSIGEGAFDSCSALTGINIPNSVTSIGNYAFNSCTALTEIIIPNSVTSIGMYAFSETGLTKISIPESVTAIDDYTFYICNSLTEINIPNSVTSIGEHAFDGCTSLTGIDIPNSVTSIGNYAFRECSALTEINIPNSVTSIGKGTFIRSGLIKINIPESITAIQSVTFYKCSALTDITIPNSVTSIEKRAFHDCISLTEITIPNSITVIGDQILNGCTGLKAITCLVEDPQQINITDEPFKTLDLSALTLTVPKGSKALYKATDPWKDFGNIFEAGINLIPNGDCSVTFDPSVSMWEFRDHTDIFAWAESNGAIVPAPQYNDNGDLCYTVRHNAASEDPTVFTLMFPKEFHEGDVLHLKFRYKATTPCSVQTWSVHQHNAFYVHYDCIGTVDFTTDWQTFDEYVTVSPEMNAFWGCGFRISDAVSATTDFYFDDIELWVENDNVGTERPSYFFGPNATCKFRFLNGDDVVLSEACYWAMGHVEYAEKIYDQYNFVEIADDAFNNDNQITSVVLPATVTRIGDRAFANRPEGFAIELKHASPDAIEMGENVFEGTGLYSCTLFVPKGSKALYAAADQWKDFGNIVEIGDVIELVDGVAFNNGEERVWDTISYKRNFNNTNWQPLYLPYAMKYEDWSDKADVAELVGALMYDDDNDGNVDRTVIAFQTVKGGSIVPNIPYLIRSKSTGEQTFVSDNTTLCATTEGTIDCNSTRWTFTLRGTYKSLIGEVHGDNIYVMSGGQFKHTLGTLNSYRFYMTMERRGGGYWGAPEQNPYPEEIGIIVDGEPCGIEDLMIDIADDAPYYDLLGRKIENPTPGIYIRDGKKVIVQ